MSTFAIGVDLGGTNLKVGLVHAERGVVRQTQNPTEAERGPEHVLDAIADAVRRALTGLPDDADFAGIGLGAPGTISWDRTTVTKPPNFPGWHAVHVADALRRRLATDAPVIVENDANVAGLGSAFYGAGREHDSFIMVTLGTGVGGAIIYQNKIFRGATGGAGEIGHVSLDYEGPYARSGVPGAAEAYLGQQFLSHHARYQLLNRPTSLHDTCRPDLQGLTPKHLHAAAEAGDQAARDVLAWAGHKLGVLLGSAVNLLDIRKIVVGGGVSHAGDFILEPARLALRQFVMPGLQGDLEIVRETLGNEVALLGAARLAFEYVDEA